MKHASKVAQKRQAANRKKLVVLGVLLSVLAVIWVQAALKGTKAKPAAKAVPPSKRGQVSVSSQGTDTHTVPQGQVTVVWPATLIRDPFDLDLPGYDRRQVPRHEGSHTFKLQGTILGEDPRALINGKAIGLGDTIAGGVVKRIEHGHVIIEVNGVERKIGQ